MPTQTNARLAPKPAKTRLSRLQSRPAPAVAAGSSKKLSEALFIASGKGLLDGGRTMTIRGRMPAALVAEAKLRTGISSDSQLLEAALASIAVADDYADWLLSQRGTVPAELDLEF